MGDQFRPIDDGFVSRNFNDRRVGGKPYGYPNRPEDPEGGSKVVRKPKPKLPSNNAFVTALKAGHHKQDRLVGLP